MGFNKRSSGNFGDEETGYLNTDEDMKKPVYDPTGVNDDAFDMDNMVEGAENKIMTAAERAALGSIPSGDYSAADKFRYGGASGTPTEGDITAAGRALLDDADASAQRTTLGLGNVDNTSDDNKPVSTATQTALDAKSEYPDAMVVEGAGTSAANQVYLRDGDRNGKPQYNNETWEIYWLSPLWVIQEIGSGNAYQSGEDVATPDSVRTWSASIFGAAPAPTVRLATWDEYITATTQPLLAEGAFVDGDKTKLDNQSGTNTGDEPAASTTVSGIVELATGAETSTGTDATRAITPDALEGSTFNFHGPAGLALGDEETAHTASTSVPVTTFHIQRAQTLVSVPFGVTVAPTGSTMTFDIHKNGTTIFSTKPTIDATEKSTFTAATAAVLSTTSFAAGDLIEVFVDAVGATIAGAGAKMYWNAKHPTS